MLDNVIKHNLTQASFSKPKKELDYNLKKMRLILRKISGFVFLYDNMSASYDHHGLAVYTSLSDLNLFKVS